MAIFSFRLPAGSAGFGSGQPRQPRLRQRVRSNAAAGAGASPPQQQGLLNNPWVKAGLISGSLSLAGDVLAQLIALKSDVPAPIADKGKGGKKAAAPAKGGKKAAAPATGGAGGCCGGYDVARAARMGTFGLLFYGPYQHWWYSLLARTFPGATIPMFATKVALNQLCLAPITITVAFAWNLALTGQARELPAKLRRDFTATMLNGWRFWVPAATVNFVAVPLQYQVLYMSTCGMLWTGYLSYQSAQQAK